MKRAQAKRDRGGRGRGGEKAHSAQNNKQNTSKRARAKRARRAEVQSWPFACTHISLIACKKPKTCDKKLETPELTPRL